MSDSPKAPLSREQAELEAKYNRAESAHPVLDPFFALVEQLANTEDAYKPPLLPLTSCAIQGGGAKGAAYAGTLGAMEALGVTKTTKEYCGASAGAITDFLIGLGYDAEQFKAVSDSMNFLDLNDYNESMFGRKAGGYKISMLGSLLSQGYVHSGEGFHEWARAQCAMVYEDPDITFAEMAEWCNRQEPPVPVPDIKFMGTALDKEEGNSECFSLKNTPNVVIADAVRASMSFPGAFQKFSVREKVGEGKFKSRGDYADGGILNNYPIDYLSTTPTNKSSDAYTFPEIRDIEEEPKSFNPGTYGLSLTTRLRETDEQVTGTPESVRLKQLKGELHKNNPSALAREAERRDENLKEKQLNARKGSFSKIARVIRKNILGGSPTSKKDDRKKKTYKEQTISIYTEGVTTLEFQLSAKKKNLIEDSGKMAFINWFIKHRDPTQNYIDYFNAHGHNANSTPAPFDKIYAPEKFKAEAVLEKEDIMAIKALGKITQEKLPSVLSRYVETMIDFSEEMENIQKINSYLNAEDIKKQLVKEQQDKLERFSDPAQNQKLKHLAWQLKRFEADPEFNAININKNDLIKIIEQRKERLHKRNKEKKAKLDANIGKEKLLTKINDLLAENTPKKTTLALAIFRGQLSNMFDLMRADPTLLSRLAKRADAIQLESLIKSLVTTASQLEQQDRIFHKNYGMLSKLERETFENFDKRFSLYLTTVTNPSLLEQAIRDEDHEKKIDYLLKSPYFSPLTPNEKGQTALHACINAKDAITFEKIMARFDCSQLAYDFKGNSILHSIISEGEPNFINALFQQPKTIVWIRALQKNDLEHRSEFGLGDTLKDLIIEKATQNLSLRLDIINKAFHYRPPITRDTPKEGEKNTKRREEEKKKIQALLNKESKSYAIFDSYIKNLDKLDEKLSLNLLTTKLNPPSHQTLLEVAASDTLGERRYAKLALALIKKCEQNDQNHEKLKTLFQSKFEGDKSLLFLSVEHNNLEFVDLCLKYHSNINHAGPHDCISALTCAAALNHVEAVKKIMSSGLSYSRALPDKDGKNALHYLAQRLDDSTESNELLFQLLTKSALITANQTKKVDVADATGKTVFDYLIESGRLGLIEKITNQRSSRTWKLNDYFEGLFTPHLVGGKTSLEALANLAAHPSMLHRPLFIHVLKNISKKTKMKQDSSGQTPLHYMARCAKEEISAHEFVHFLQSKKRTYQTTEKYHRRTNIEDNEGNSVLRALIMNNREDIVQYLHNNWTGWKLNAIFDLHTIRSDGKSDMQFILELQSKRSTNAPGLNNTLDAINRFLPHSLQVGENKNPNIHNDISSSEFTAAKIWADIHGATTVSSPTGIREKQADFTDVTSLRNIAGQTVFRQIIDSKRDDVLEEFTRHCKMNWRLDHYFDLTLMGKHQAYNLEPGIPFEITAPKVITDLEYALSPKIGTPKMKALLIKNLSTKALYSNKNDSNRRAVLHHIALDENIDPRLFWEVLKKNKKYKANSSILDIHGKTAFRLLVDSNRADIMADMIKQCGRYASGTWNLNHYFDFDTSRPQDEMNDLEYLILAAKKEPAKYHRLLKLVKMHTHAQIFNDALKSTDVKLKNTSITSPAKKPLLHAAFSAIHGAKLPAEETAQLQPIMRQVVKILEALIDSPAYMNKNSPAYGQFVKLMTSLNAQNQAFVIAFMEDAVSKIDKEYEVKEKFRGLTPCQTFLSLVNSQFKKEVLFAQNLPYAPLKQKSESDLKSEKTAVMTLPSERPASKKY